MKPLLLKFGRKVKRTILPGCPFPHSFSQEGEDMVLARVFEHQPKGFYVDVGAHHPVRFSNTYFFYRRGWRGINIDATPGSMEAFRKIRPRDTNVEAAVSDASGSLEFSMFNEPALNTFDQKLARERDGKAGYRIMSTKTVPLKKLSEILEQNLPGGQTIDFLSVDVEGLDLPVLKSNDWKKFRPTFVLAEDFATETVEQALSGPIASYLRDFGYRLFAKTAHTLIFRADS
jgi:FkbM family methyltransferase